MRQITQDQFITRHREIVQEAHALTKRKNDDYSNPDNALENFTSSLEFGVPVAKAVMVRLNDKFQRLKKFFKTGKLTVNEPGDTARDTILDAINYLVILLVVLEQDQEHINKIEINKHGSTNTTAGGAIEAVRGSSSSGEGSEEN